MLLAVGNHSGICIMLVVRALQDLPSPSIVGRKQSAQAREPSDCKLYCVDYTITEATFCSNVYT